MSAPKIAKIALALLLLGSVAQADPEPPHDKNFSHTQTRFPLDGKHAQIKCAACHAKLPQGDFWSGPDACELCHDSPHQGQFEPPNQPADGCRHCHTTSAWKPSTFSNERHAAIGYPVVGAHTRTSCASCHKDNLWSGAPRDCEACHVDPHAHQKNGPPPGKCQQCHNERNWDPPSYDHLAKTGVALVGAHQKAHCADCHGADGSKWNGSAKVATCADCHGTKLRGAPPERDHGKQFGRDCAACHDVVKWLNVRAFDHAQTHFPLERRHAVARCLDCHNVTRSGPALVSSQCRTCHDDPHRGRTTLECDDCHRADNWLLPRYDHDRSEYRLNGAHFAARCRDCHLNDVWVGTPRECIYCHRDDLGQVNAKSPSHRRDSLDCTECHNDFKW